MFVGNHRTTVTARNPNTLFDMPETHQIVQGQQFLEREKTFGIQFGRNPKNFYLASHHFKDHLYILLIFV